MTMIAKDIEALVDRINNYLGNGGLFNPELMEYDKVSELIIDCREAFATALLKEAQAGREAVAYRVKFKGSSEWELHAPDDGAFPVGDFESQELYTSPPTQEVEALKALLAHAKCNTCDGSGVLQTGNDSIEPCRWCQDKDEALATIDNTNDLQEPNTWSE